MIAEYENHAIKNNTMVWRYYALNQTHKHQPEMQSVTGLSEIPIFNPCVGDFYAGMTVWYPSIQNCLSKKWVQSICMLP
jgi:N-acetyl-gamma-glutamyl-phosphate reductase